MSYTIENTRLNIHLQKSFEGEYRCIVDANGLIEDEPETVIRMPWVIGQDAAIKQLGKLLTKAPADVLHAIKRKAAMAPDTIKQILSRP